MSKKSKILITAQNSYIGNSFASWVMNYEGYETHHISCRTDEWKEKTFANYDVVLHVAGIAHVQSKKNQEALYYKVNRDLTIDIAKKAKADGVKQFIFLSSMIVFGESNSENPEIYVTESTIPLPSGFYGRSKLLAEQGIQELHDECFQVAIIRPPMVYGAESKGNFPKLLTLAKITPVFPQVDNTRSVIYIDNLCEFIKLLIDHKENGVFHPQNDEYMNTSELVKLFGVQYERKIRFTSYFNPLIKCMARKINSINKVFGTFAYDKSLSKYKYEYNIYSLEESIRWIGRKN